MGPIRLLLIVAAAVALLLAQLWLVEVFRPARPFAGFINFELGAFVMWLFMRMSAIYRSPRRSATVFP